MLDLIRSHILLYRLVLIGIVAALCVSQYSIIIVLWLAFLYIVGKVYEVFFMRGGDSYARDAFTLKLTLISNLIDSLWAGFRK